MFRIFVTIAIISFIYPSRINCFKLSITRDLGKTDATEEKNWCFVEITEDENVLVKVDIPLTVSYSGELNIGLLHGIFIYFANEQKEILKVNLNDTIEGKFYEIPYKYVKEMKGEKTEKVEKDNFHQVVGEFPRFWLPNNCSKISAAVECSDGKILNYYGIQNLKISLSDLMILEEFKNYKSN